MNIPDELQALGFTPAVVFTSERGRYATSDDVAANLTPPLVYVIVDRNGDAVKTGRSLKQSPRQRFGNTAKGMNRESTKGQNEKPVVADLRLEVDASGPLITWAKGERDEESAKAAELVLFDKFRGRIDRKRG